MDIEDIQLIRGVGFLKELSIFSQLEEENLKAIWQICSFLKCERGQDVYYEGQIATHIYIIKEGEVSISRIFENDTINTEKTLNMPERIVRKNMIWQNELAQKKKEKIVIAKLSDNQYFGELELLSSNINTRFTCATCETQTSLYSIPKKQLTGILGTIGFSTQICQIFQLRAAIYDHQIQKVIEGRKKRKIKIKEEQIELDAKNKESVKVNFNRLRQFSQKCQYIQEHMEKLQNKKKPTQDEQPQQNLINKVIWQQEKDRGEQDTFISSQNIKQMMKFFENYNFGPKQNQDCQYILDILNKTKNHHLVRLQYLWKTLKQGKPSLKQSMGQETDLIDHLRQKDQASFDHNDLDEKRKNLLSFMKKRNILSKQSTIVSYDNKSSSAYSQQFRNTSQTNDRNSQFDEIISDDLNFQEKERYNSIFQNTQSSKTQFQSRKGSQIIQLESPKYYISYYNNKIMNQQKADKYNQQDTTQQSIYYSRSQDIYLKDTNLKKSFNNTNNSSNISLPWLQKKNSKPHFVKIFEKSNEIKELNKNIFTKPKLQIYS